MKRKLLSALAALLIAGCYEVPVTGRRAMNLVDDKEVTKMSIGMFENVFSIKITKELQRFGFTQTMQTRKGKYPTRTFIGSGFVDDGMFIQAVSKAARRVLIMRLDDFDGLTETHRSA
mgnify:CR=1 FL=1